MKFLFIIWAAVACATAASGCTSGDGGSPTSPINPFGTEPAPTTGNEPTGGGGDSIAELCAAACANIQAYCPNGGGGSECALQCASAAPPGCESQFRAFVQCVARAQIICSGSDFNAPQCEANLNALGMCGVSTGGTGTAGGTGAAGATGGTPQGP